MKSTETKIIDLLTDLKENHQVISIKNEISVENTNIEELLYLKELALKTDLELTVKIGGCESIKDINDAKRAQANVIVAPMIESAYAMEKFTESYSAVYSENKTGQKPKLSINIETICGFNNLEDILSNDFAKNVSSIVFGRTDMVKSLGINQNYVNNPNILKYAQKIAEKTLHYKKELAVGGGICPLSLAFLNKLPKFALTSFETRRIIFSSKALLENNAAQGIRKAFELELILLQNKQNFFKDLAEIDLKRIKIIEERCKKSLL